MDCSTPKSSLLAVPLPLLAWQVEYRPFVCRVKWRNALLIIASASSASDPFAKIVEHRLSKPQRRVQNQPARRLFLLAPYPFVKIIAEKITAPALRLASIAKIVKRPYPVAPAEVIIPYPSAIDPVLTLSAPTALNVSTPAQMP